MNGAKVNNKVSSVLFIILLCPFIISAQEPFRIMFYNVENYYDTINNPKTLDDEFTPEGVLRWNSYKFQKKTEDISKVISSLGGKYPPAIVGLCEVENRTVLDQLVKQSSLARHKYQYVVTNSKDSRGSNVALLYQRDQMKLLNKQTYTPVVDRERKTRDILHVTGVVVSGDTLDIFVCHFPSRSEGIKKSEPYRLAVAKLLREKIEVALSLKSNPCIIVMGDFNDYPSDKSMKEVLKGKSQTEKKELRSLYNMHFLLDKENNNTASYKYKGKWGYIDQFIVSGGLLNSGNLVYIIDHEAKVYAPDFLLEEDVKHGGEKPYRTYSGYSYLGGTSDHLPIYIDLYIKE